MAAVTKKTPAFDTVGALLKSLGNLPASRVRLRPHPGEATEKDLLKADARRECLVELVDFTLVEKAVGFSPSMVAAELIGEVGNFVDAHDLGVITGARGFMRLRQGVVRAPDLSFVPWDRFPRRRIPREPIPDLFPELAVEVLRVGNTPGEMKRKRRDYFLAGTRLVWIVDPVKRLARVYTSPDEPDETIEEHEALDGGDVLPGFTMPLAPLFEHFPQPEKKPRRKKTP